MRRERNTKYLFYSISWLIGGLVAAGLAACADSSTHVCINGVRCPAEMICVEPHDYCAPSEHVEPCLGKEENAPCAYLGYDFGICQKGVCELDDCASNLDCNDGNPCTRDTCQGERCNYEPMDGMSCDDGNFCNGADTCVSGTCEAHSGDPCTKGSTYCDEELDACAGCIDDSECPDGVFGAWSDCVSSGDVCSLDGVQTRNAITFACEGMGGGTICLAREGELDTRGCLLNTDGLSCNDASACTANDQCAGGACQGQATSCNDGKECTTDSCDAREGCQNIPKPFGDGCGSGSGSGSPICDGLGNCVTCANSGAACSTGNPCEQGEIRCVNGEAECVAVSIAPAGTVCRSAAGDCDVAEVCNGVNTVCPDNAFASSSLVCNPAAGVCDVAETCTGNSATCPNDVLEPAGTVCSPDSGGCDVEEVCNGNDADCPEDRSACLPGEFCDNNNTCSALSSIDAQGGEPDLDGDACSDVGIAHPFPDFAGRIIFRGPPNVPFIYYSEHVSCSGSTLRVDNSVTCDNGLVGLLDNTGKCIYTLSNNLPLTDCPVADAGRWELYAEINGVESNHVFHRIYNSTVSCVDTPPTPRTCSAAGSHCPSTGACNLCPTASGPMSMPEDGQ